MGCFPLDGAATVHAGHEQREQREQRVVQRLRMLARDEGCSHVSEGVDMSFTVIPQPDRHHESVLDCWSLPSFIDPGSLQATE